MIIWSGWGWLVAVIVFGCALLTEVLVESAYGDDRYYQEHGWPKSAAFVAAALAVSPVASYSSRKRDRHLIDAQSGEPVVLRASDTLFFIAMKYWPPLLAVIGLVMLYAH